MRNESHILDKSSGGRLTGACPRGLMNELSPVRLSLYAWRLFVTASYYDGASCAFPSTSRLD